MPSEQRCQSGGRTDYLYPDDAPPVHCRLAKNVARLGRIKKLQELWTKYEVRGSTLWTIARHDGPNHLGL